jgi:hypothetical protein
MALSIGIRYAMAGNVQGLTEWRQEHVGAVPIRLDLKNGSEIVGSLETYEAGGDLVVDTGEQDRRIPQGEVEGFTLLDSEPPLDQGDEVRGES